MNRYQLARGLGRGVLELLAVELRNGTLPETVRLSRKNRRPPFVREPSHADLLETKARKNRDRPFLHVQGSTFTYRQMDENANRAAHFLRSLGGAPGRGLAIMMKNSSRWLDAFFGAQRLGMTAVPVNTALRGDQLAHILNHSEAGFLCIDQDLLPFYGKVRGKLNAPPMILVNPDGSKPFRPAKGRVSLDGVYAPDARTDRPPERPREGDPCLLLYTSGTTGMPKGVPTPYGRTNIRMMSVMSRVLLRPEDIYFTCLPLFHANALLLTMTTAMAGDAQMAMIVKFSASRFWAEIRDSRATVFNSIGAMIPILMKQPVRPEEREHRIRYVLSAACPADMWEPFEKRFGVRIVEAYGAVDGGGFVLINYGNAPVGSLGKPLGGKYRLVDDDMNDVPTGRPGELIFRSGNPDTAPMEYYKDRQATSGKVKNGWLHTGDLVYADKKGVLYFVGRKTEALRRRGENISAYEVEQAILQHPAVLECAVYAVPSELGEDDVMAAVVPVEGKSVDAEDLASFLQEHLARFAIPRYYRFLSELPKTETQRVIKRSLEQEGVTQDTVDTEPGGKKKA